MNRPTLTASQEIADFSDARSRILGGFTGEDTSREPAMVALGASADMYYRIEHVKPANGTKGWGLVLLLDTLIRAIDMPIGEALDWVEMAAAAPVPDEAAEGREAYSAILEETRLHADATPGNKRRTQNVADSRLAALRVAAGPLAPLAWAAGLPLDEARSARVTGEPRLRLLAGLRGFQFTEIIRRALVTA
jgi:hypothetical protein